MTTLLPYPGLTVDGYTNTSTVVADKLLSDFFLSDKSQTYAFGQNVVSFAKIIHLHQGKPDLIASETEIQLRLYLQKFFPSVEISVEYRSRDGSDNAYDLYISLELVDTESRNISLVRLLQTKDNAIVGIMAYLTNQEET